MCLPFAATFFVGMTPLVISNVARKLVSSVSRTHCFCFLQYSPFLTFDFCSSKRWIHGSSRRRITYPYRRSILSKKSEFLQDAESEFLLPREKFVILGPHDEKKRNRCRYANAHSRAVLLSTNLQRRREDIVKRIHGAKKRVREAVQRENIYTIPNVLCVLRIAATPGLGWLVLTGSYPWALSLFCIAGFTDLLDGYIARHWKGQSSMLGSFLDPLADKFLVATLFVTLTVQGLIPVPLTALIISRDVCLMTAGFIVRYKSLPQPRTLSRYFDGTLATAQLAPTQISKFNTAVQLGLVASTLTAPVLGILPETSNPFFLSLWIFTAATTVVSGASYVSNRDTYRLRPRSQQNPKP